MIFMLNFRSVVHTPLILQRLSVTYLLPDAPQLPFTILLGLLAVYVVKSGVENLGKCSIVVVVIFIVVLSVVIFFSVDDFVYTNLLPIMGQGVTKILSGALSDFSFPMAETVLLMTIIGSLKPEISPYKVYFWGAILGGFILFVGTIKNILVVGFPLLSSYTFPHYDATKLIVIGGTQSDVIARIEGSVSMSFLLSGFVKVSVCLFAATKGLAKLFNIDNYKKLAFPVALAIITFSATVYTDSNEMIEWVPVYKYYALPFEIILPIILLVIAEIKKPKKKKGSQTAKNA